MCIFNSNSERSRAEVSLYCVWIRANDQQNAPLVAVWIDSKMRAFESAARELSEQPETAAHPAEALSEEPEGHRSMLTPSDVNHSIRAAFTMVNIELVLAFTIL